VNFTTLSEAGDEQTFFCICCELQAHKAEIESLQSSITELQTSLFELEHVHEVSSIAADNSAASMESS